MKLGAFDDLKLLAVSVQKDNIHVVTIKDMLREKTERNHSVGDLNLALKHLSSSGAF